MKINLQIVNSAFVYAQKEIENLNEKALVPNPLQRRRLTRSAKILIYLADKVGFGNGRIVFGSEFGECSATSEIIGAIVSKTNVSPTAFQNSVHNTPASYLSIQNGNTSEIITVSDYQNSSDGILKTVAVKSMLGKDEMLAVCVDSLNIEEISVLNKCGIEFLECGVALRLKHCDASANVQLNTLNLDGFLDGHKKMIALHNAFKNGQDIFEVAI